MAILHMYSNNIIHINGLVIRVSLAVYFEYIKKLFKIFIKYIMHILQLYSSYIIIF
jgi:hypothetical protein